MAQISSRDIMAMYAPVIDAFDVDGGAEMVADQRQSQANINFSKRVMSEALPLTRMLDSSGNVNVENIKKAKPFSDPYSIWEDLQTQMPSNSAIDPVAFQQQVEMGQSLFDRNYANQVLQMEESGKSMKEIRNALKNNKELYKYAIDRGIIPPEKDSFNWGSLGKTGLAIGAGIGAEQAVRTLIPSKAPLSVSRELRQAGFKVVNKNGRPQIQRMSDIEIANRDKLAEWDELKKPKAKRNTLVNKNKTLEDALAGKRRATNKILEKSLNPKTGTMAKWLSRISKTARGKGMVGAAVGLGTGLLADALTRD